MTNRKSTKRALLGSVMAMVLCLAMLVGATFAWFTDTASTGVNKIQAGKLDVALEMKDAAGQWVSAEGKTLQFKKAANAPADEAVLWEPGCTYELPELRVVNNGNLALKYKLVISGIRGDAELNNVIDWTMTLDGAAYTLGEEHHLAAKNGETVDADVLTISGKMQESAGNAYQGLTIDGVSITVVATQDTVEYDSLGNDYDAAAKYNAELVTAAELRALFVDEATGKLKPEVTLTADYMLVDEWTPIDAWGIQYPVVIDGQGHTIYNMTVNTGEKAGFISRSLVENLTIKNLTFNRATVVSSGNFVGTVIGYQYGDVTLENVQVLNSVVKSTAGRGIRIGGLVGFSVLSDSAKLHLKDCAVKHTALEGYHNTCGLVGTLQQYNTYSNSYSIENCVVSDCAFLWGSPVEIYNNFAVCEGGPYNARYDAIIDGVTATNNTVAYR